jgi:hypothetical protein
MTAKTSPNLDDMPTRVRARWALAWAFCFLAGVGTGLLACVMFTAFRSH